MRDGQQRLKKQAARFRVFAYPPTNGKESYPRGGGIEITLDQVEWIRWTVHLANKKAVWYQSADGIEAYGSPAHPLTPPLRNPETSLPNTLVDPGPRVIPSGSNEVVRFDGSQPTIYDDQGNSIALPGYPQNLPSVRRSRHGTSLPLLLGSLMVQDNALTVIPGSGRAGSIDGTAPLTSDTDNRGWFDDTADGPVHALIKLNDGTVLEASAAWCVTTLPAFAPQIPNVVSLLDEVSDTWIRKFGLRPNLFSDGQFHLDPQAVSFEHDVQPILQAPWFQQWVSNPSEWSLATNDLLYQSGPNDQDHLDLDTIRPPGCTTDLGIRMPLLLGDHQVAAVVAARVPIPVPDRMETQSLHNFDDQWPVVFWRGRATRSGCVGGMLGRLSGPRF